MTTIETYLIGRLKDDLKCRNSKNQNSRIFARYEIKRTIKALRNERDGTNARLAETYRQRAIAFARGDFAALR